MTRTWLSIFAIPAAVLFASPTSAWAQNSDLDRVERLMAEGRFGSARSVLQGWLDASGDLAVWADRQRGTWLRALLTVDPEMAELDLRRLVVEYPGGPFSDDALIRLAHGARAQSDDVKALEYLDVLLRDYPESPLRGEARSLAAQIESPSPATEGAEDATDSAGLMPFTIQLGAFSTESRARLLEAAAAASQIQVRLVRISGSDLIRVRTGAFGLREEAEPRALEIIAAGFPTRLSGDREAEGPIP